MEQPGIVNFSGRVDIQRRRDELVKIGEAMGIPNLANLPNKTSIIGAINQYIAEHPEVQTAPRFQGLFMSRKSSTTDRGKAVTKGHRGKTSADKAAEDAAAEQGHVGPPTG